MNPFIFRACSPVSGDVNSCIREWCTPISGKGAPLYQGRVHPCIRWGWSNGEPLYQMGAQPCIRWGTTLYQVRSTLVSGEGCTPVSGEGASLYRVRSTPALYPARGAPLYQGGATLYQVKKHPCVSEEQPCIRWEAPLYQAGEHPCIRRRVHPCIRRRSTPVSGGWCTPVSGEGCTPLSGEGAPLYQVNSDPASDEEHPCIRWGAPLYPARGAPLYQEKEHPCNPGEGVGSCGEVLLSPGQWKG